MTPERDAVEGAVQRLLQENRYNPQTQTLDLTRNRKPPPIGSRSENGPTISPIPKKTAV